MVEKKQVSTMSEEGNIQRVELINYKNDAGNELLGLGIELADDPNGGIQSMESRVTTNVISRDCIFLYSKIKVVFALQCYFR